MLDLAVVGGLKWGVKRKRPGYGARVDTYVVEVDRYSFPSGHASRAMGVVAGLGLGEWAWWRWWVLGVGLSRVVGGRHYVGDVVGGWAVGWAVGWVVRGWVDSPTFA